VGLTSAPAGRDDCKLGVARHAQGLTLASQSSGEVYSGIECLDSLELEGVPLTMLEGNGSRIDRVLDSNVDGMAKSWPQSSASPFRGLRSSVDHCDATGTADNANSIETHPKRADQGFVPQIFAWSSSRRFFVADAYGAERPHE